MVCWKISCFKFGDLLLWYPVDMKKCHVNWLHQSSAWSHAWTTCCCCSQNLPFSLCQSSLSNKCQILNDFICDVTIVTRESLSTTIYTCWRKSFKFKTDVTAALWSSRSRMLRLPALSQSPASALLSLLNLFLPDILIKFIQFLWWK